MDNLTASLLSLLMVSPSIAVLSVLIARRVQDTWEACVLSARRKLKKVMECNIQFPGKLCNEKS